MLNKNTCLSNKRYTITRHIRTGGQASVYEAWDNNTDRKVAIKELQKNEEWAHKAFKQEARLLSSLRHLGLPTIHDFFAEKGSTFLVMEFIPGDDLEILLKKRTKAFPIETVIDWAFQIMGILEYLHNEGSTIIHRDINPRNIKLNKQNQVILLDFGIAKDGLSKTPISGGSSHYSPPEQLKDEGTDIRSDIYSLAATLYHLATFEKPPDSLTRQVELLKGNQDPLYFSTKLNNRDFANVLSKAMSLNPNERQQSVNEMRQDLQNATGCQDKLLSDNITQPTNLKDSIPEDVNSISNRIVIELPGKNDKDIFIPARDSSHGVKDKFVDKFLEIYHEKIDKIRRRRGIVGVDIGSTAIKVVELQCARGGFELTHLGYQNLQSDTIVDGHITDLNHVSDTINRIWTDQGIKTNQVAISLSGHAVIVKKITMPTMPDEELDEQIHWEAEQYIPFDINDVNLYHEVIGRDPSGQNMDVLLVACKRDKIAQFTQVISQAGKQQVIIDIDAFALQNAYEINYNPPPNLTVALLDIGASVTTMNIVCGTTAIFTRDISAGGNQYTDLLQKELDLTFDQAEALKRGAEFNMDRSMQDAMPVIDSVSEMLALEISRTLDFFRATAVDSPNIDRMLVAGGVANMKDLLKKCTEKFQMPVERFDAFRAIQFDRQKFDEQYLRKISPSMAIAVGLAVRVAEVSK